MLLKCFAVLTASLPMLFAQLTPEQRVQDFHSLAALYAKRYAPLTWKKQVTNFDMLDIQPWLQRVRAAKNDIEYHEIALEYVARLEDTHSWYRGPGLYSASLGISVDIYDGKVLIDSIDRTRLPVAEFSFQSGDELVSLDGRSAEDWITELSKFRRLGNKRATRRMAADRITFRTQSVYPRVVELGDTATMIVRRESGETNTHVLPWQKTNLPYRGSPAITGPKAAARDNAASARIGASNMDARAIMDSLWNWSAPAEDPVFQGETHDEDGNAVPRKYVMGYGARNPAFMLPEDFVVRLGRSSADFHFSGVYTNGGLRIGYLRLPNFSPPNLPLAIRELEMEIQYLNANTDGLVVDVSRNTGGGCYMLDVASRLIPNDFWFFGEEIRPVWDRIASLQSLLELTRRQQAEQWMIETLSFTVDRMVEAYNSGANLTVPVPACTTAGSFGAVWDNRPAEIVYAKPMIVLIDEFSTSAGDIFPAMIQDNRRAPLVGMRTNGAGGSVSGWPAGPYTEGSTSNTNTLVIRREVVANAPDVPVNRYIENTGVRPDIELDIMTRENLMTRGRPFVEAFTRIIADEIRKVRN